MRQEEGNGNKRKEKKGGINERIKKWKNEGQKENVKEVEGTVEKRWSG